HRVDHPRPRGGAPQGFADAALRGARLLRILVHAGARDAAGACRQEPGIRHRHRADEALQGQRHRRGPREPLLALQSGPRHLRGRRRRLRPPRRRRLHSAERAQAPDAWRARAQDKKEVTARKLLGFLIAVLGIAIGAFLSGSTAVILVGYWDAKETGGWDGRMTLLATAAIGALIGYGIYRLGRFIAR